MFAYFGLGTQPIEQSVSSNCAFGGHCTFGFTGTHKKLAWVCSRSSDRVHPGPHNCADNLAFSILPLSTGSLGMPVISGPAYASVIDRIMVRPNAVVSNRLDSFITHTLFVSHNSPLLMNSQCIRIAHYPRRFVIFRNLQEVVKSTHTAARHQANDYEYLTSHHTFSRSFHR